MGQCGEGVGLITPSRLMPGGIFVDGEARDGMESSAGRGRAKAKLKTR